MLQTHEFTAGGKKYRLRFSINALAAMESLRGGEHYLVISRRLSALDVRAMMCAGLEGARKKGDAFTLEKAGEIIDELGGYSAALKVLLPAYKDSLNPVEEREEGGGDESEPPLPSSED